MSEQERVGERTRRGLSWNLVGAITTNAMRLLVVYVLGRTLTSYDFGIVAAAISVNVLFYSVRDLGVGLALVQLENIDRGHIQTAFTISAGLGAVISLAFLVCAPLIAHLYRIPEATNVIAGCGTIFFVRGLSITSRQMCQREMNFRLLALADTFCFGVGSMVSMALAVTGTGPWSLVIGYIVEEGAATLIFLKVAPPPFLPHIRRDKLRDLMGFGSGFSLSQIAATVAIYGDNMIVGHALGVRMLGYYTRAYDLVKFPSAVFDNVVGNVLFPAFAKLRANGPLMALNFRRAMFANAIVLLPASAALFVVAPETIRIMMGDGWGDVVLPFRILVVTMMFRTSAKVGQTLASAAGSIRAVAVVNVIYMLAVVGGALASISWGIAGVAVSTAAAITLTFSLFCFLGVRQTALRWSELFLAHLPGLALAAIAAGSSWGIATWLRARHEPAAIVFAASAVASVLSVLAVGMLLIRRGRGDFEWIRTEALRLRRGQ